MSALRQELASTLNRASAENASNTPDFILAEYLVNCLEAFDKAVLSREHWYSIKSAPGQGTQSIKHGQSLR